MAQVKVGSRSNGFFQLIQLSDYVFWVTCEVMELKFPVRILPLLPQLLLILTIICFTENLPLILLKDHLLRYYFYYYNNYFYYHLLRL